MFCSPLPLPCWAQTLPPPAILASRPLTPQGSSTALTEQGSSVKPDGSLAAHRLLVKDNVVELVRESKGLAEARERLSSLHRPEPSKHVLLARSAPTSSLHGTGATGWEIAN